MSLTHDISDGRRTIDKRISQGLDEIGVLGDISHVPDYIENLTLHQIPEVAEVRHRFVTVNGIRLHIAESGDPGNPAVLLLHGFPQHWYVWRHVMAPLARTRHVIAVDFRGFGWSDAPPRGYSTDARVNDILDIMEVLHIPSADLVGHDWGAMVAMYLALEHPDRVDRLVAISMLHLWPLQRHLAPSTWRWWVTALFEWPVLGSWMLRKHPAVTKWLLTRDAIAKELWTDGLVETYVTRTTHPARARAAQHLHAQLVLAMPRFLLGRGRKHHYGTPTLVIGGENDRLIPPGVLAVPKGRSDAIKVQVIAGGHFLVDDNPQQVTEAILTHLANENQATSSMPS